MPAPGARTAGALVFSVVVGCSRPTAVPPTVTPTASVAAQPTVDPQTGDAQDAFLANVSDLTAEVSDLAISSCSDLTDLVRANPNEVPQIHGFAATLKRVGSQQAALDSDDVRSSLAALDMAVAQLDATLARCGIPT